MRYTLNVVHSSLTNSKKETAFAVANIATIKNSSVFIISMLYLEQYMKRNFSLINTSFNTCSFYDKEF